MGFIRDGALISNFLFGSKSTQLSRGAVALEGALRTWARPQGIRLSSGVWVHLADRCTRGHSWVQRPAEGPRLSGSTTARWGSAQQNRARGPVPQLSGHSGRGCHTLTHSHSHMRTRSHAHTLRRSHVLMSSNTFTLTRSRDLALTLTHSHAHMLACSHAGSRCSSCLRDAGSRKYRAADGPFQNIEGDAQVRVTPIRSQPRKTALQVPMCTHVCAPASCTTPYLHPQLSLLLSSLESSRRT